MSSASESEGTEFVMGKDGPLSRSIAKTDP
jgi:hypothetical protein